MFRLTNKRRERRRVKRKILFVARAMEKQTKANVFLRYFNRRFGDENTAVKLLMLLSEKIICVMRGITYEQTAVDR